jgi:hypothetical protein
VTADAHARLIAELANEPRARREVAPAPSLAALTARGVARAARNAARKVGLAR